MKTPEEAAAALEKALDPKRAAVTVADAAAASGLALRDAEQGLHFLVKEYRGHLRVTEDGDILFKFPHGFSKPWDTPGALLRVARKVGRGVEGAARFVVRAWVAIVLVAYVGIFVALMIAMMFARGSGDSRESRGGSFIGLILRVVVDALWWTFHPWSPMMVVPVDDGWTSRGRGRAFAGQSAEPRETSKFYESVDRFFFGPKSPPEDPDATWRAIVTEIRAQKGRIGLADVIRLTGKSREELDPIMSRLLLDYGGSVEVSEEGGLAYRFPELRKTAGYAEGRRAPAIWDKVERATPITGNTDNANLLIGGLNAFNLVASAWVLWSGLTVERIVAILQKLPPERWPEPGVSIALGIVPFVFSVALFLFPLGRVLLRPLRERKARRENGRRAVLREIIESAKKGGVSERELVERYRFATGEELSSKEITKQVVALGGDVDLDRAAEGIRYRFPDLELEARAVEAEREAASEAEAKVGKVIFSSED
jgi:hypothetical protein